MESVYRHVTIPSSLTWTSDQPRSIRSTYDASWPPADRPDRIITRNYGTRLLVCTSTSDLPSIERSAPIFAHLSVTDTYTDSRDIARVIDAATTHLEPGEPHQFSYGVKYHEIQTMSNTPDRFLEDLENIRQYVAVDSGLEDSLPKAGVGRTDVHLGITGTAIWPIRYGWFYVEGEFHPDTDTSFWQYGLLLPNPLVDPTDVLPFFEAVTDHPPRVQHQWPERMLIADGSGTRPALTHDARIADELTTPRDRKHPALPIHATNPFYGTDVSTILPETTSPSADLVTPLTTTSTLLYELTTRLREDVDYRFDRLVAIEPPTTHSLFVAARATRHKQTTP